MRVCARLKYKSSVFVFPISFTSSSATLIKLMSARPHIYLCELIARFSWPPTLWNEQLCYTRLWRGSQHPILACRRLYRRWTRCVHVRNNSLMKIFLAISLYKALVTPSWCTKLIISDCSPHIALPLHRSTWPLLIHDELPTAYRHHSSPCGM